MTSAMNSRQRTPLAGHGPELVSRWIIDGKKQPAKRTGYHLLQAVSNRIAKEDQNRDR